MNMYFLQDNSLRIFRLILFMAPFTGLYVFCMWFILHVPLRLLLQPWQRGDLETLYVHFSKYVTVYHIFAHMP